MRDNTVNMTEGSPVRLLLAFSVPMLIGNIFQQLYNLVDSVIVGQFVGAQALAAIGATGKIQTNMILTSAFVEGCALFAIVACAFLI